MWTNEDVKELFSLLRGIRDELQQARMVNVVGDSPEKLSYSPIVKKRGRSPGKKK